jgi:hypothetical protein
LPRPARGERLRIVVTRRLVIAVVVAALGSPATTLAQEPPATDVANGPIAAWSGVVAWSAWDAAAGGYRLVVERDGARSVLPVPPARFPFDVQAGPGPDGAPWLVWSRCDGDLPPNVTVEDCDIVAWDVAGGRELSVAAASHPRRRELHPAIWRNRVAFAHTALGPATRRTRTQLAVATLAGGRARPAPGMPVGNCEQAPDICGVARPTAVVSLALREDALAVSVSYGLGGFLAGICGLQEVRLADLRTGLVRQMSPTATCGLSGTQYSAVRFSTSGALWYVRSCGGDPAGCNNGRDGPFRYSPSRGRTRRLVVPRTPGFFGIGSLAVDGEQPLIAEVREGGCTFDPAFRCAIMRRVTGTLVAERARRARGAPGGYRVVRRLRSLVVARPPRRIDCFDADPVPRRRAVLWLGVGARSRTGNAVPMPVANLTASARGLPAVRRTLPRSESGNWRWRRLVLGARGCGRKWRVGYRVGGRRIASFTVRVAASPRP